jgi:hypothetical protein
MGISIPRCRRQRRMAGPVGGGTTVFWLTGPTLVDVVGKAVPSLPIPRDAGSGREP